MLLKVGSRGNEVKQIQEFLGIGADGIFGKGTEFAVKEFQKSMVLMMMVLLALPLGIVWVSLLLMIRKNLMKRKTD